MDALIFTNLAPEHIESHGSYEKYRDAKLSIARALARSHKPKRFMVANADDKEGALFLNIPNITAVPFRLSDGAPVMTDETHSTLHFHDTRINSSLPGTFNAYNILAAATCACVFGVSPNVIAAGIARLEQIAGRMERVEAGQTFPVIVDYAHTPDSLTAVYDTFPHHEKICVLGNTGGGRDTWKRPVMGGIADEHCAHIILTNEDPYDEDPVKILGEIAAGMNKRTPEIIIDRRAAITRALVIAQDMKNPAVVITGKGTDPYIMGPHGTKLAWDDRQVAREELSKILNK
jgi:UDP-N-acetylmuramyl-tripeptide synthetase